MRAKMMWMIVAIGCVACVLALWGYRVAKAYRFESREFLAPPRRPPTPLPPGLPKARRVTFTLPGVGKQSAIYVPPERGALVIYAHGSPGEASGPMIEMQTLAQHGIGALSLDLPGYGLSEGRRSWDASYLDAVRAAVAFARAQPEVDPARIGGFGFSMGTIVIGRAAARDDAIGPLILVSALTDLREQLAYQFRSPWPGVARAAQLAARRAGVDVDGLQLRDALRRHRHPLLLIAGDADDIIPFSMPSELRALHPNSKLWVAHGVGHVGFMEHAKQGYLDQQVQFWTHTLLAPH